ncbi:hypothetical protein AQUCO_03800129v1 [Aquilegia coerulea]|uniref:ATP-dependent DNA helicase n=1 Tax=Aquilegia coerulea TaxID=218851 RepID=A0A2G5CSP8_AQUCA|nr:hypothetical protein AQUCO_03800129v1 [Aquilegia coerulea]
MAKLRSKGKIVLAIASSGIASLLLLGGRTAHSRFNIPLNVDEYSTCNITKRTELAKLIQKADLVIWDEATKNHKYVFEVVDKTFRDIMHSEDENSEEKYERFEYLSADSVSPVSEQIQDQDILYPTEFLNTLQVSGVPNHAIELKVGVPIMLLRNTNPKSGMCNGTRLIVTKLGKSVIGGQIITDSHVGERRTIPRIVITTMSTKWAFILRRRQFPIKLCFAMTINKS